MKLTAKGITRLSGVSARYLLGKSSRFSQYKLRVKNESRDHAKHGSRSLARYVDFNPIFIALLAFSSFRSLDVFIIKQWRGEGGGGCRKIRHKGS